MALLAFSCKHAAHKPQSYFNEVFRKVDSMDVKNNNLYSQASMQFLDAAFAKAKEPGICNIANMYFIKKDYYWETKRDYDSAKLYTDSVITLLENSTSNKPLAKLYMQAFFARADFYFLKKSYDEAIYNYTRGKLVYDGYVKDPCSLYGYYNRMADILFIQHKYLQAVAFYHEMITMAPICITYPSERIWTIQGNLDNIGMCYLRAGITDSAFYYFNAALDYISKNEKRNPSLLDGKSMLYRGVIYSNLAPLLYQQGKPDSAETLYLKAIEETKMFDPKGRREYPLALAQFYLENKQVKNAGELLRQVAAALDSNEITSVLASYFETAAGYYSATGQVDSTTIMLQHAYAIKDSLQKRDQRFNAIDITLEIGNSEQKANNLSLKKDNEIKNSYLLIIINIAVMSLIIILLVWNNLKHQSRYEKELALLNNDMVSKNEDLEKTLASLEQSNKENHHIMRVVAHDLKNPLSAIRTLVYSMQKKEQSENGKQSLQIISTTCTQSITLIKDLLDAKNQQETGRYGEDD